MEMQLDAFFAQHPVFTTEEIDRFLAARPGAVLQNARQLAQARKSLLSYHRQAGHILRIRQGLWATVPAHRTPDQQPVDEYLIAAKLTPDAVIAYHGALALHGLAHSLRQEIVVLSRQSFVNPLRFRGNLYRAVTPPKALPDGEALTCGVETRSRQGVDMRITGLERTVVDCLDRLMVSGGWEEVWRSLEGLDAYLDLDLLVDYVLKLRTATTTAKVGYFLSVHQARLKVPESVLDRLRAARPRQVHYVLRDRVAGQAPGQARLVSEWNLMVPTLAGEESLGDVLV